jgi:hypothetical protein
LFLSRFLLQISYLFLSYFSLLKVKLCFKKECFGFLFSFRRFVHIYTQLVWGTENTCLNESKLVEFSFEYWLYASGLLYTKLGSFSSHTIPINTFWIKCINLILVYRFHKQLVELGQTGQWTIMHSKY